MSTQIDFQKKRKDIAMNYYAMQCAVVNKGVPVFILDIVFKDKKGKFRFTVTKLPNKVVLIQSTFNIIQY